MKKLIGIFFVATLALVNCKNKQTESADSMQTPVDPKLEFAKLNAFLRKFEEPSQAFRMPTDKLIKVTGKQGTIIHIDPADMEMENGTPVGKDVDIELRELSTKSHLLRSSAQTVADGQLLVSGGAYFINVTSNGEKVKLKEGEKYSVEFVKLADDEMTLYYGQRDSSDKMNWKQANMKLSTPGPISNSPVEYEAVVVTGQGRFSDTARVPMKNINRQEYEKLNKETAIKNKVYNPVDMNKFGWINCDRLFEPDASRTDIRFAITNKVEDVNYANVYLIFKDIKSVMQASYFIHEDTIEGNGFDNLPLGMTVRFLAVCYQNEKVLATLTDTMSIKENQNEKLTLQEMNEADFDKLMKSVE